MYFFCFVATTILAEQNSGLWLPWLQCSKFQLHHNFSGSTTGAMAFPSTIATSLHCATVHCLKNYCTFTQNIALLQKLLHCAVPGGFAILNLMLTTTQAPVHLLDKCARECICISTQLALPHIWSCTCLHGVSPKPTNRLLKCLHLFAWCKISQILLSL